MERRLHPREPIEVVNDRYISLGGQLLEAAGKDTRFSRCYLNFTFELLVNCLTLKLSAIKSRGALVENEAERRGNVWRL